MNPTITPIAKGCKLCAGCSACVLCGPTAIAGAGLAGLIGFL